MDKQKREYIIDTIRLIVTVLVIGGVTCFSCARLIVAASEDPQGLQGSPSRR